MFCTLPVWCIMNSVLILVSLLSSLCEKSKGVGDIDVEVLN